MKPEELERQVVQLVNDVRTLKLTVSKLTKVVQNLVGQNTYLKAQTRHLKASRQDMGVQINTLTRNIRSD